MKSGISSGWTFFYKFLFPLLLLFPLPLNTVYSVWFGGSGPATHAIMLAKTKDISFFFPVIFAVFSALIFGRLKRLYVDKGNLYISNYFEEIVVPSSKISRVEEYPGPRLRPAKLFFCEATRFGTEVEFIPRDSFLPWRRSLVVAELRKLANLEEF